MQAAQAMSFVALHLAVWYWPAGHDALHGTHAPRSACNATVSTRATCAAGAWVGRPASIFHSHKRIPWTREHGVDEYVPSGQGVEQALHWRSRLAEQPDISNETPGTHWVQLVHVRSPLGVHGTVSYVPAEHGVHCMGQDNDLMSRC